MLRGNYMEYAILVPSVAAYSLEVLTSFYENFNTPLRLAKVKL